MKTPVCNFCIKSGILCPRCQEKFKSGEVSNTDINVMKLLTKLEDKYPILQKTSFYNAFEVDNILAIIVGNGDLRQFLSNSGRITREIAENTVKRVKILEKKGDTRKFFEDLFAPVAITTINKIWLPDGSTETRVILSGNSRRLPLKINVIKELARKVRGITLRIAFESQREKDF